MASPVRARLSSLRLQNVGSDWNGPVRRIVSRLAGSMFPLLCAQAGNSVEVAMTKLFFGPIALVIAILPVAAIAQTTGPSSQDQSVVPTTPNSGAGIPGQPGNKSGPPARRSGTSGSGVNSSSDVNGGMQTQMRPRFPGNLEAKAAQQSSRRRAQSSI
jgi:hypothetical protein